MGALNRKMATIGDVYDSQEREGWGIQQCILPPLSLARDPECWRCIDPGWIIPAGEIQPSSPPGCTGWFFPGSTPRMHCSPDRAQGERPGTGEYGRGGREDMQIAGTFIRIILHVCIESSFWSRVDPK